jgi:DNA-binding winged helix-turn-helix (wHTH) protein
VIERYQLEKRLITLSDLHQVLPIDEAESEVRKAVQIISTIRRSAAEVVGCNLNSYLIGLVYYALQYLVAFDAATRHTRHELSPYFHSLLSAAMICQRLTPEPPETLSAQAVHDLWLDEANREVWVEGRSVSLSPQEFSLLLLLYQQRGQLCTRTMIAEQVFAGEFTPDLSAKDKRAIEEGRINTTISRLRRKIEPDPDRPKYITAVRAVGYKLEAEESV